MHSDQEKQTSAKVVSLEAIFLSTFVLISQNRQAAEAERRADLGKEPSS